MFSFKHGVEWVLYKALVVLWPCLAGQWFLQCRTLVVEQEHREGLAFMTLVFSTWHWIVCCSNVSNRSHAVYFLGKTLTQYILTAQVNMLTMTKSNIRIHRKTLKGFARNAELELITDDSTAVDNLHKNHLSK